MNGRCCIPGFQGVLKAVGQMADESWRTLAGSGQARVSGVHVREDLVDSGWLRVDWGKGKRRTSNIERRTSNIEVARQLIATALVGGGRLP